MDKAEEFRSRGIEAVRPVGQMTDPARADDAPYEHCPPIAARLYSERDREADKEKPRESASQYDSIGRCC